MSEQFRRIVTLLLAFIFIFQIFAEPVFAIQNQNSTKLNSSEDNDFKSKSILDEDNDKSKSLFDNKETESKSSKTEIETNQNNQILDKPVEKPIEEIQKPTEENLLPSQVEDNQTLPEEDESLRGVEVDTELLKLTEGMRAGESRILNSPKTSYQEGERLDISNIEIVTLDFDNNPHKYTFLELKRRVISPSLDEELSLDANIQNIVIDIPDAKELKIPITVNNLTSQELTEEQILAAEKLNPGEAKVFKEPKTNYKLGEKIDLTGIEIIAKSTEGEIKLYTLKDLLADESIKVSPKHEDGVPSDYYAKLLDRNFIKEESDDLKEKIANYLQNNDLANPDPFIKISIPGFEELKIKLDVEENELQLSPRDLFRALLLKNSTMMLVNADKLTYKSKEELNFDGLELLLKDENGYLRLLNGKEIEEDYNFELDLIDYKFAKNELEKREKQQNIESEIDSEDLYKKIQDISRIEESAFTKAIKDSSTKTIEDIQEVQEPVDTHITVSAKGYDDLYIPLNLINENTEINSIDENKNLDLFTWGVKLDENKSIFKVTLDVKNSSDIKEIFFDFLDAVAKSSDNIKIARIVKTDGVAEEDITLTDPIYRIKENLEGLEDLTAEQLSERLQEFEIINPVNLTKTLETGYKYVFFIEMNTKEQNSNKKTEEIAPKLLISTKTRVSEDLNIENNLIKKEIIASAMDPSLILANTSLMANPMQAGITANLNVKKVDQNGEILPGAEFNLAGSNNFNKTATVPKDGILKFEGLTPGEYFLAESKAPDGYSPSDAIYKVIVDERGEITYTIYQDNSVRSAEGAARATNSSRRARSVPESDFIGPVNISDPVGATNSIVQVAGYDLTDSRGADKKLEPNNNESLKLSLSLKILQKAVAGDTFTIKLDDQLVPSQLMPLNDSSYIFNPPTVTDPSENLIASGVYDRASNTITYTLEPYVNGKTDITVNINLGNIGVNRRLVENNGQYNFINTIAGSAQMPKTFNVDYGVNQKSLTSPELDAKQFITELNPQTNKLKYVLYLNPDAKGPNLPTTLYLREMLRTIDSKTGEERFVPVQTETDVLLSRSNINFYKIPRSEISNLLPDSLSPDLNKIAKYKVTKSINTSTKQGYHKEIPFAEDMVSNAYIAIVEAPYTRDAKDVALGFVWQYNNKAGSIAGSSYITTFGSSASGDGTPIIKETTITVVNKRNENKGSFTINKKDENNSPLINAVFELKDIETGVVKEEKSNQDGKVYFEYLVPGTYTLKEKTAPEGYKKSNKQWKVYVRNDGKTFVQESGEITNDDSINIGRNISTDIILKGNLTYTDANSNNVLDVATENSIKANLNLTATEPINPGDYFILEVSDTLHYNMLQPDKFTYPNIFDQSGQVLATPSMNSDFDNERGTNKKIKYTFTEAAKGLQNLNVNLELDQSVNVNEAKYNGQYSFSVKVGTSSVANNINIQYNAPSKSKNNENLNILTRYLYTNDQSGMYTQLIFVNPLRKNITGTNTVTIFADPESEPNMANISKEDTKITVYKYRDKDKLPDAVILEKDRLEEINTVTKFENYNLKNDLSVYSANIDFDNIGQDAYVIKVEGLMKDLKEGPLNQYAILRDSSNNRAINGSGIGKISGAAIADGEYVAPKLEVTNTKLDKTGKFEIKKTDESDQPLAGAEFKLTPTQPTGEEIIKTSEEGTGKVLFDNLKPGNYILEETLAPQGYKKTDTTWNVRVDVNGVTTVVEKVAPVGSYNMRFRSAANMNELLMSEFENPMAVMALPNGTWSDDITINTPGSGNYGDNKVQTSAKYIGDDTFEVKLDITAGQDLVENGPATDVVIVVQDSFLTPEVKNALINKINEYGDNVKVGVHFYNERTGYNSAARLMSKVDAINAIRNGNPTSYYPNTPVRTQYALQTANNIFASGASANKELIMIVGNSIGASYGGITTQINNLNKKGVNINNFYVGSNSNLSIYLRNWDSLLGLSSGSTINASNNNAKALSDNLEVYGRVVKKAIDNAAFNVSFNKDFSFVTGSTTTDKNKMSNTQWHSSYDSATNSIKLKTNELSLNGGYTATMTFKVKSNSTVSAGKEYKLINDITFKPNASAQNHTIIAPSISVEENKLKIDIESKYDGPMRPDTSLINFTLKRRVENGSVFIEDNSFSQNLSMGLNKHISNSTLPKKDARGNLYQYYVTGATSNDSLVKVIYVEPEEGISNIDGTITIHAVENKGFNVNVDWQGLTPVGMVTAFLEDGNKIELTSSTDYFYKDTTPGVEKKVLSSATGAVGYKFDVVGSNGSYTIKVSKTSTDIESITVKNEKEPEKAKFTVIKTDESGDNKLDGAIFTLTGANDYKDEQTTKEGGKAVFENLLPGDYTLTETKAPNGYSASDKTWQVHVAEDGTVTTTPSIETQAKTDYSIYNPNWRNIKYQASNGYWYDQIAFKQELTRIGDTDSFNLRVYYDRKDPYFYGENYVLPLIVVFNTKNFTVTNNGQSIGMFQKSISPYSRYTDGYFDFTVTPKNPKNNETITPVASITWNNLILEQQYKSTITPNITDSSEPNTIIIKNKKANLTVFKKDQDGEALDGAEFTLKPISPPTGNSIVKEVVNGQADFLIEKDGKYELTETKAPSGYDGTNEKWIVNVVKGVVTVNKEGYNPVITNNNAATTGYIGNSGVFVSSKITEMNRTNKTFKQVVKLNTNNRNIYNLFLNTDLEGSSNIVKYTSATLNPSTNIPVTNGNVYATLQGYSWTTASFEITLIGEYKNEGEISSNIGLEVSGIGGGIKTSFTPADTGTIDDTIGKTEDGVVAVTVTNIKRDPRGKIKIHKVGEEDQPLQNVKFKLTGPLDDAGTDEEKIVETDDNGEILFEKLAEGTYSLQEIETVDGYILKDDIWKIEVDADGNTKIISGDASYVTTETVDDKDADSNTTLPVYKGKLNEKTQISSPSEEQKHTVYPSYNNPISYTSGQDGEYAQDFAQTVETLRNPWLNDGNKNYGGYLTYQGNYRTLFQDSWHTIDFAKLAKFAEKSSEDKDDHNYDITLKVKGNTYPEKERDKLGVIILYDNSNSMNQYVSRSGNTRVQLAKAATTNFVNSLSKQNPDTEFALVTYGSTVFDGKLHATQYQGNWYSYNTPNNSYLGFTTNPANITNRLPSRIPSQQSDYFHYFGGTFTGAAFLEAEKLVKQAKSRTSNEFDRLVIVNVTDGVPTLSPVIRNYVTNQDGKATTSFNPIIDNSNNYPQGVKGDGQFYYLNSQYGFNYHRPYYVNSMNDWIQNHGLPTILASDNIKNLDAEVFNIGIAVTGDNEVSNNTAKNLMLGLSSGTRYNYDLEDAHLLSNAFNSIINSVYRDTISEGIITDPMGDKVDLVFDGDFDSSDYTITATKDGVVNNSLLQDVKPTYNSQTRTIKIEGLRLGLGEELIFKYKVKLRADDPSVKDNVYYFTNGETTLNPNPYEGKVLWNFPVPSVKKIGDAPPAEIPKLDITNYKKPKIEFLKTNINGDALEGAHFKLYREELSGDNIEKVPVGDEIITQKDGKITLTNLDKGNYILIETKAPIGYEKLKEPAVTFEVTDKGEITNIHGEELATFDGVNKIINKELPEMEIELRKIDDTLKPILAGSVEFSLEKSKSNTTGGEVPENLKKIVFDNLGEMQKDGLKLKIKIPLTMDGEYILTETKAPAGYLKSFDKYYININQKNRTIKLTKVTDPADTEKEYLKKGKLTEIGSLTLYSETEDGTKIAEISAIDVVNIKPVYPSTGGLGTILFTLFGISIMAMSIVAYRRKKVKE